MVNRWHEDDEVGYGVGLLFDVDVTPQGKRVSKRDPKTRHQRPQSEWTAMDVSAEFRSRVEELVPALRGYLTSAKSGVMVAATRKRLNTTPEVELALMEMFLIEEREIAAITKRPDMAYRYWVATWPRNMSRAREMCGQDPLGASVSDSEGGDGSGYGSQPQKASEDVLEASDGTRFPNTALGRRRLARYEEGL